MIYSNFETMLRDIEGYIRSTGAEILVNDDPANGYVGFCTADQSVEWKMPLRMLIFKRWAFGKLDPQRFFEKYLTSEAGRQSIVTRLVKQAKRSTITDPEDIARLEKHWHDQHDRTDADRSPTGKWQVKIEPGDDGLH